MFLLAASVIAGVGSQLLAQEFIAGSWWSRVFIALGPTIAVGGAASVIADYYLRRSFYEEIRGVFGIHEANTEFERLGVYPWREKLADTGFLDQMAEGSNLIIFLNTGESVIPRIQDELRQRFAAGLSMQIALIDPVSESARAVECKEGRESGELRRKILATLDAIKDADGNDSNVTVYLHGSIAPYAAWSTETKTYVEPYAFAGTAHTRQFAALPALILEATTDADSKHRSARKDLEAFLRATDYQEAGLVKRLSLSEAIAYAERHANV